MLNPDHEIFSFQEISLHSEGKSDGEASSGGGEQGVGSQEHDIGEESLDWNGRIGRDRIVGIVITRNTVGVDHLAVAHGRAESVLDFSVGEVIGLVGRQEQEGGESIGFVGSLEEDVILNVSEVARNGNLVIEVKRGSLES